MMTRAIVLVRPLLVLRGARCRERQRTCQIEDEANQPQHGNDRQCWFLSTNAKPLHTLCVAARKSHTAFGSNMYVQVDAQPLESEDMDNAFVNETTVHGTPSAGAAGASASHLIQSDDSETDEELPQSPPPDPPCSEEEEEKPLQDVKPQPPRVPTRMSAGAQNAAASAGAKATAGSPKPPTWATRKVPSWASSEEAGNDVPLAYGERAPEAPFVLAEHALRAAEEVRLAGNDAFFASRFEEAQQLYKVAGRHLESATDLENPVDLAVPGYAARKLECTEKSKLNLAACRIKLGDYVGCIAACNEILHVAPHSVKALYRCGMAHMLMQDYETARTLLARASSMEPSERAIQQAVRECATKQREAETGMRDMAKNMFSGKPLSPPKAKAIPPSK